MKINGKVLIRMDTGEAEHISFTENVFIKQHG